MTQEVKSQQGVNWTKVLKRVGKSTVNKFIQGDISGDKFYDLFKGSDLSGMVRRLIRDRGVDQARLLAKKAMTRRA